MTREDWINDVCLENEVISTRNLSKEILEEWLIDFNATFGSEVTLESFKRRLREGKVFTRKSLGLDEEVSKTEAIPVETTINNVGNVLVIGDLHEPFTRNGYREFCLEMYEKHNCETVVFIGDVLDSHYSSFHDPDPDSDYSAGGELTRARGEIQKWYKVFPKALVCEGNHDQIPQRRLFNSGLSKQWMKSIADVLEVPNWKFSQEFILDDVFYTHGTGRQARQRMKQDLISLVQGHYHSQSYIENIVGRTYRLFACQIGCGIDDKSYAFAYAKNFSKSHINVAVIKERGTLPILEYMDLEKDYT